MDKQSHKPKRIIERSDGALTLYVPINIKRRSGRKKIDMPCGRQFDSADKTDAKGQSADKSSVFQGSPTALQMALARAYEWAELLDSGKVDSITTLAKKLDIDNSYVSRILNLTLLAPDIVQMILDDQVPDNLTVFNLATNTPRLWDEQRYKF